MLWHSVTQEELNGKIDKMLSAGDAKFMGINLENVMHNIAFFCLTGAAIYFGFTTGTPAIKYLCCLVMAWMAIVGIKWED